MTQKQEESSISDEQTSRVMKTAESAEHNLDSEVTNISSPQVRPQLRKRSKPASAGERSVDRSVSDALQSEGEVKLLERHLAALDDVHKSYVKLTTLVFGLIFVGGGVLIYQMFIQIKDVAQDTTRDYLQDMYPKLSADAKNQQAKLNQQQMIIDYLRQISETNDGDDFKELGRKLDGALDKVVRSGEVDSLRAYEQEIHEVLPKVKERLLDNSPLLPNWGMHRYLWVLTKFIQYGSTTVTSKIRRVFHKNDIDRLLRKYSDENIKREIPDVTDVAEYRAARDEFVKRIQNLLHMK